MKKRSSYLLISSVALMLVMYNCQRVGDPLPTGPNAELLKDFNAIKMKKAPSVEPEAVIRTPSALIPSPKILEVQSSLKNPGANGSIPAPVQRAVDDLSAALSPEEITLLAEMTPAMLNSLMEGGALPANVQGVLDRAASHPVLSTYFPKLVLPTVKEIKFPEVVPERDVTADAGSTDRPAADNTCKKQAQEAYQAKLAELKEERKSQLATAKANYNSAVFTIQAQTIVCKSGVNSDYDQQRAALRAAAASAIAQINANTSFSRDYRRFLIAVVNANLSQSLKNLNALERDEERACELVEKAALAAAAAAYETNKDGIEANYDASVLLAKAAQAAFIANCEYQQGIGS